jgi:type III restriction enzyme
MPASPTRSCWSPPASGFATACGYCSPATPRTITASATSCRPNLERLGQAKIVITNFPAFKAREQVKLPKLNKDLLNPGQPAAFTETPHQMVRRVCRELGNKKNILVINDEAHHCYRRKPESEAEAEEKLTGDDRKEAEKRNEDARLWISGVEAIQKKLGLRAVYDLSATPFFLKGSGYPEGTLFNWVVSDFSLIDAIEAGIVKVPRVPVADDNMTGEQPTYRDLWVRIREDLPKKGRGTASVAGVQRKLDIDFPWVDACAVDQREEANLRLHSPHTSGSGRCPR